MMKNLFRILLLSIFTMLLVALGPPAEGQTKIPDGYALEISQYQAVDIDNVAIMEQSIVSEISQNKLIGSKQYCFVTQNLPVRVEMVVLKTLDCSFNYDNLTESAETSEWCSNLDINYFDNEVSFYSIGRNILDDNKVYSEIAVVMLL